MKESNFEAADQVVDLALEYSKACRGKRNPDTDKLLDLINDHQYFGLYDYRKAQIKLAKGELQEAQKFINRALETFAHHEQDSKDLIEMTLKLQTEVDKAL